MADRTLIVRVGANVQGLVSQLKVAQGAMQQWDKRTQASILANSGHINTLSTSFGLLGGAMIAAASVAVKTFADFDEAMDSVQASTMESAENMELLRQAALDAGAETVFSATEAAAAIEELAKAGVSTQDILGGGLAGALDLAASGGIAVADAAAMASTAMNQFGLTGSDASKIADVLAASAGKANGEVGDFALALKYVGPIAAQLGVSLEETSGALALLAQNGVLADSAGTGLRGVLMSLTAPSKVAADAMKEYGVNAFDAQGNFIGLTELVGQLEQSLGGLTEAERSAALGRMFGNEQITVARILYQEGADAVRDWTDAVDDQGYASEQAAIRLNNLKGDVEGFMGALETAMIGAGEGADGPLRALVQSATDVVNAFSELPDSVQQGTLAVIGGGGFALLAAAGVGQVFVKVAELRQAFVTLGTTARTTGLLIGGAAAGVTLLAGAITFWAQKSAEATARAETYAEAVRLVGDAAVESAAEVAAASLVNNDDWGWWQQLSTGAESATEAMDQLGISIADAATAVGGSDAEFDAYIQSLRDMEAARKLTDDWDPRLDPAKFDEIIIKLEQQRTAYLDAAEGQSQMDEATAGFTTSQSSAAGAIDTTTSALDAQNDAIQANIDAQREAAGLVLDLRSAQNAYEAAIDSAADALEENGRTLDVTTEKGRANRSALDEIAQSGWDLIDSMRENGASQDRLQSKMDDTRDAFIEAATSMGLSEEKAEALADSLGLIPETVTTTVTVETTTAQTTLTEFVNLNSGLTISVGSKLTGPLATGGPYASAYATGGAVAGPGSGTSDSILARVSNGEHIWTAAEVARAGGHGAMQTLRQAALAGKFAAGLPAFRSGGPVLVSSSPVVQVSAPSGTGAVDLDRFAERVAQQMVLAASGAGFAAAGSSRAFTDRALYDQAVVRR